MEAFSATARGPELRRRFGSLCSICARLFEGQVQVSGVPFTSEEIIFMKPRQCRICAYICSKLSGKRTLFEITYAFSSRASSTRHRDADKHSDITLSLEMYYSDGGNTDLASFHMIPAQLAQSHNLPHRLSRNTNSDSSFGFLKSQLAICRSMHKACRQRLESASCWHPNRLLVIDGMKSQTVCLRDRDELERLPYITLSHCWGSVVPMKLTAETEGWLRAGISANLLPKTFRDALYVATTFSVTYVWIDSLCIYQDSVQDWHKESSVMGRIYSSALCNIAASKAADSSEGLFSERDPTSQCAFWVRTTWLTDEIGDECGLFPGGDWLMIPRDQWEAEVDECVLNRRAWVMQERLLSTRIMHFSANQIFWECLENRACETFPNAIPSIALPGWPEVYDIKDTLLLPAKKERYKDEIYDKWQVLVINYAKYSLSVESDKLVAINGIRRLIQDNTGNDLCCGLWRSHLVQDLGWFRDDQYTHMDNRLFPCSWRAPSWSWASNNVTTRPSNMRHHMNCFHYRKRVTIEAIHVDELSSGQLKDASLTLRGKILCAICVDDEQPKGFAVVSPRSMTSGNEFDSNELEITLDDPNSTLDLRADIVCLALLSCNCSRDSEQPERYLEALALVRCEHDRYKRIGHMHLYESFYDFYVQNESKEEHNLVML